MFTSCIAFEDILILPKFREQNAKTFWFFEKIHIVCKHSIDVTRALSALKLQKILNNLPCMWQPLPLELRSIFSNS